jgi:hypothetical protein
LGKVIGLKEISLEGERWAEIEDRYYVSDYGRIVRLGRAAFDQKGRPLFKQTKLIKTPNNPGGYPNFSLKNLKRTVHRFVALYFVENPSGKPQVNHLDGDKANNHYTNLQWVTPAENSRHAQRMGLSNSRGERNYNAILTSEDVIEIQKALKHYEAGLCQRLADKYGVSVMTVYSIRRGERWKHIKTE